MKKLLVAVLAVAAFLSTTVQAQNVFVQQQSKYEKWSVFGFGFLPGIPACQDNTWVRGLKLGFPIISGKDSMVSGLELGLFGCGTDYFSGVQASLLLNDGIYGRGVQANPLINLNESQFTGLQASCIANVTDQATGMQSSLFNFAGDFSGFQFSGLTNTAARFNGLQLSCFNAAESLAGCQIGAFALTNKASKSLQISAFNVNERGTALQIGALSCGERGIQIGLINVMKNGFLPIMILFNFSI